MSSEKPITRRVPENNYQFKGFTDPAFSGFAVVKEMKNIMWEIEKHNRHYEARMTFLDRTSAKNFKKIQKEKYPKLIYPKSTKSKTYKKDLIKYKKEVQRLKFVHRKECLTPEEQTSHNEAKSMLINTRRISLLKIMRREIKKQIAGSPRGIIVARMMNLELDYMVKYGKDFINKKIEKMNITKNEISLSEVGMVIGVTRERTRQIEDAAIKELKHPSNMRVLKEWAEWNPDKVPNIPMLAAH